MPSALNRWLVSMAAFCAADAETRQNQLRAIFEEYLRDEDPFPERLHINALAYRLLWDQAQTEARWADWALDQTERWPNTKRPPGRSTFMRTLKERLEADSHSSG